MASRLFIGNSVAREAVRWGGAMSTVFEHAGNLATRDSCGNGGRTRTPISPSIATSSFRDLVTAGLSWNSRISKTRADSVAAGGFDPEPQLVGRDRRKTVHAAANGDCRSHEPTPATGPGLALQPIVRDALRHQGLVVRSVVHIGVEGQIHGVQRRRLGKVSSSHWGIGCAGSEAHWLVVVPTIRATPLMTFSGR